MAKPIIRTRPDGTKYPITPKKGGGAKVFVAGVAIVAAVGGGTATGLGGAASVGSGAAEALPGNLAGDVADSLPGRSLKARKAEAEKSAKRGRKKETFSRFKLKQLKEAMEREGDCLLNSTGRVREYLARHRCTSLHRNLFAVGDGHGNAAVLSIARVGFPKKSDAEGCEKVEEVQGSGDIKPLGAALLGLDGVKFSGHHFQSRVDGRAMVVAETETVAGKVDPGTLDALADVSVWFPKL
ncbi:hypothetical protein L3Q65_32015 [Amycolatopsis sp. FU40]|uniref:hypothetical protein n=1 Tax=Amycolatopsis sp. FU40 TaxID=2914159 RepID=UPI001F3AA210|nr:hypothetical protein [Amycolatopsis sp. FU40]UKD52511.1 hypothetical protein L3Q65_32015 [Amycolatopsis sp. FU40]